MADLTEGLAPYFNHICYVVRDMDAAQSWFKRVMGVKHFGQMEAPMGAVTKARMRGKPCDFSIAYALGTTGAGPNIELIVPDESDNIYRQFLNKNGPHSIISASSFPTSIGPSSRFARAAWSPSWKATPAVRSSPTTTAISSPDTCSRWCGSPTRRGATRSIG